MSRRKYVRVQLGPVDLARLKRRCEAADVKPDAHGLDTMAYGMLSVALEDWEKWFEPITIKKT